MKMSRTCSRRFDANVFDIIFVRSSSDRKPRSTRSIEILYPLNGSTVISPARIALLITCLKNFMHLQVVFWEYLYSVLRKNSRSTMNWYLISRRGMSVMLYFFFMNSTTRRYILSYLRQVGSALLSPTSFFVSARCCSQSLRSDSSRWVIPMQALRTISAVTQP